MKFTDLVEQARNYFEDKNVYNLIKLNNNIYAYCKEKNLEYKQVNNDIMLQLVILK
jgi:hypothetical protein|nr:MAG TPA: hypothetical protein [Bacteriophage sp.]